MPPLFLFLPAQAGTCPLEVTATHSLTQPGQPCAEVRLRASAGTIFGVRSNEEGRARAALQEGRYAVPITKPGFIA